jgi:transcriptional regulator of acetoin/glycerol metabolism
MREDLVHRRHVIEQAKAHLFSGDGVRDVDPVVVASWQRCAPALADELHTTSVGAEDEARERWDASPLRRAVPGLVQQLDQASRSGDLIALVTDAEGRVLWQSTPKWLRGRAARIGLQPGGVWHEGTGGTNGVGTALAADRPVTVFATEHWISPVQDWVCYAAPVHAPDGTQVGAIDLSTTWRHANPLALSTVTSMARLVEHELRLNGGVGGLVTPGLDLRVLGEPQAIFDGTRLRLTLRQLEILTILAIRGQATLGELHAELYGDRPVAIATLKAEMSHLRSALAGHLTSRPYRLTAAVHVDAVRLLDRLDTGDVEGAARLYRGQLLPVSESPFIVAHRHHVDVALRTALLRHGTPADVLRFTAVHPYDVEVLEHAQDVAPVDDPLVPAVAARLAVANAD